MLTHIYTWLVEEIRQTNKNEQIHVLLEEIEKIINILLINRSKYNFYFNTLRKINFISHVIAVGILEYLNKTS
jgi:hypothetical protein